MTRWTGFACNKGVLSILTSRKEENLRCCDQFNTSFIESIWNCPSYVLIFYKAGSLFIVRFKGPAVIFSSVEYRYIMAIVNWVVLSPDLTYLSKLFCRYGSNMWLHDGIDIYFWNTILSHIQMQ